MTSLGERQDTYQQTGTTEGDCCASASSGTTAVTQQNDSKQEGFILLTFLCLLLPSNVIEHSAAGR